MSAESSAEIIRKLKENEQKSRGKSAICTLYTFAKPLYNVRESMGIGIVKVARCTAGHPVDWIEFGEAYCKDFPKLRLLEIASIEWVDDREIDTDQRPDADQI